MSCYILPAFARHQDPAAGPAILDLLRRDQLDEPRKATVLQAMGMLVGSTWDYDAENWGPDKPGNREAIEKLEAWLMRQRRLEPGGIAPAPSPAAGQPRFAIMRVRDTRTPRPSVRSGRQSSGPADRVCPSSDRAPGGSSTTAATWASGAMNGAA